MQKINSEADLKNSIFQLKYMKAEEGRLLKDQFLILSNSLKPINLIISTLKEASKSKELKETLLSSSVKMTLVYLSKAVLKKVTLSPVKKILGTALIFGIKILVAKNPNAIKSFTQFIFQRILGKKEMN